MTFRSFWVLLSCTTILACQGESTPAAETTTSTTAKAESEKECAHGQGEPTDGCSCAQAGNTNQLTNPAQTTRTDGQGNVIAHLGNEFNNSEEITVAALLADPDKYQGKAIRIRGNVAAMCMHRRAWFAVVGDDQTGDHVRIFTTPVFLVPHDSIGKTAVAEGIVELLDIPARQGAHIAEEHKLGEAAMAPKQVIIRATGAEFG
ncbi:MAG: hypothetical protein A2341_09245 [Deltaproteobacteria bacterium RIFOXYB12_FULL_58_9]|nr:MAG: hypothetical protein A2341_09245 [Deltaproteobacteria bacterium RIFOXYB12_FULL_58_9]